MAISIVLVLALAWSLAPATRDGSAQEADAPPAIPSSVRFRELEHDGRTLWLYLPRTGSPCALVVVPPAGGTLLSAPALTPGDRVEHLPYAEAGFAVLSFSLSGTLSGRVTPQQVKIAIGDFAKARGGIVDATSAIEAAIAAEPSLAGRPLVAAGHSSAANLALALAAEDARIRAVIAHAPVADTMKFLAERSQSQREARDELYQRRGLSADTTPEQTLVIDRALAFIKQRGRTLLIGPGLDLTRREGFSDDLPLRAYQVERLMKEELDCADVRPEVIAYLKQQRDAFHAAIDALEGTDQV